MVYFQTVCGSCPPCYQPPRPNPCDDIVGVIGCARSPWRGFQQSEDTGVFSDWRTILSPIYIPKFDMGSPGSFGIIWPDTGPIIPYGWTVKVWGAKGTAEDSALADVVGKTWRYTGYQALATGNLAQAIHDDQAEGGAKLWAETADASDLTFRRDFGDQLLQLRFLTGQILQVNYFGNAFYIFTADYDASEVSVPSFPANLANLGILSFPYPVGTTLYGGPDVRTESLTDHWKTFQAETFFALECSYSGDVPGPEYHLWGGAEFVLPSVAETRMHLVQYSDDNGRITPSGSIFAAYSSIPDWGRPATTYFPWVPTAAEGWTLDTAIYGPTLSRTWHKTVASRVTLYDGGGTPRAFGLNCLWTCRQTLTFSDAMAASDELAVAAPRAVSMRLIMETELPGMGGPNRGFDNVQCVVYPSLGEISERVGDTIWLETPAAIQQYMFDGSFFGSIESWSVCVTWSIHSTSQESFAYITGEDLSGWPYFAREYPATIHWSVWWEIARDYRNVVVPMVRCKSIGVHYRIVWPTEIFGVMSQNFPPVGDGPELVQELTFTGDPYDPNLPGSWSSPGGYHGYHVRPIPA